MMHNNFLIFYLASLTANGFHGKNMEKIFTTIQNFVDCKKFGQDSYFLELHALHAFTSLLAKVQ
jgi:hypothetical protein